MKRAFILAIAFTGFLSEGAIAQQQEEINEEKEVKMENVNGVKTLTIKTTSGEKSEEEIYTGEAAEKKMAELESEHKEDAVEVKMIMIGGKKQLTIISTKDGIASQEVYKGRAAKTKIKEIDAAAAGHKKTVIIEKTETIEKVVE
jgi:hypothetical protein